MQEKTLKQYHEKLAELGLSEEELKGVTTKVAAQLLIDALSPKIISSQEDSEIAQSHQSKKEIMREILSKQPTIRMLVPLESGDRKGVVETTRDEKGLIVQKHISGSVHPVIQNGFTYLVPKGTYAEVPQQIAQMIEDKFSQESAAGAEWKADRIDPNTGKAVADRLN